MRSVRYSTLPALDSLDRLGDVHRDRADLGVRHLALRAEHAAEPADHRHHVRRRDGDVEVGPAAPRSAWRGRRRRRSRRRPPRPRAPCRPWRRRRSSRPCRGRAGSAIVPRSCSSAWRTFRPVRMWTSTVSSNLARWSSLTSRIASRGRVLALAVDLRVGLAVALAVLGHQPSTSTPIERAVPAMIFDAWSMSCAFRSCSFGLGDRAHLGLRDRRRPSRGSARPSPSRSRRPA